MFIWKKTQEKYFKCYHPHFHTRVLKNNSLVDPEIEGGSIFPNHFQVEFCLGRIFLFLSKLFYNELSGSYGVCNNIREGFAAPETCHK